MRSRPAQVSGISATGPEQTWQRPWDKGEQELVCFAKKGGEYQKGPVSADVEEQGEEFGRDSRKPTLLGAYWVCAKHLQT